MPDFLPGVSSNDDEPTDPRLREPGDEGMPGELIDDPANQPGDQDPPSDDDER